MSPFDNTDIAQERREQTANAATRRHDPDQDMWLSIASDLNKTRGYHLMGGISMFIVLACAATVGWFVLSEIVGRSF